MLEKNTPITEEDLFDLHRSIQTAIIIDIYKPIGGWKKEPNGTTMVEGDKQIFFEYSNPLAETHHLVQEARNHQKKRSETP